MKDEVYTTHKHTPLYANTRTNLVQSHMKVKLRSYIFCLQHLLIALLNKHLMTQEHMMVWGDPFQWHPFNGSSYIVTIGSFCSFSGLSLGFVLFCLCFVTCIYAYLCVARIQFKLCEWMCILKEENQTRKKGRLLSETLIFSAFRWKTETLNGNQPYRTWNLVNSGLNYSIYNSRCVMHADLS